MLERWKMEPGNHLMRTHAATVDELKERLEALLDSDCPDVLIIGGHGHKSLSGFWVHEEAVRWHDLAFLLRARLPATTTFVFYSCNGGYPGIAHIFGRTGGPDYVFGPTITVLAEAMTHATEQILAWKRAPDASVIAVKRLIDDLVLWAQGKYPDKTEHSFIRVIWDEGHGRYPDVSGPENPKGELITLLGWGL